MPRKSNFNHGNITEPSRRSHHKKTPTETKVDANAAFAPPPKKLGEQAMSMVAAERQKIEEKCARLRKLREERATAKADA
jgi:hypothetical protein